MKYGRFTAVDGVSFTMNEGEIVGLLGPNGAGKTTTMRVLTTFLVPNSGWAKIHGKDILKETIPVRHLLGYLPENPPLYPEMEVREYLRFIGKSRGLDRATLTNRIGYVTEACFIKDVFAKPIGELSRGYRQRVGLAQALLHDPAVLILDEPTTGLDPIQIVSIRNLITSFRGKKTILFSSHIMQEVVAVTDRAIIIDRGKKIADGLLADIRKQIVEKSRVVVRLRNCPDGISERVREGVPGASIAQIDTSNGLVSLTIESGNDVPLLEKVSDFLAKNSMHVAELHEELPSLEDAFLTLINQNRGVK